MSIDLHTALHDAAQLTTAARPPMAPAPVMRRIRRRRAVRTAVESGVGLATVGAVATVGGQLGRADEGAVWPAAVTLDGQVICGRPMPAIIDPSGDGDVHITGSVDGSGARTLDGGDTITVDMVLSLGDLALPEVVAVTVTPVVVDAAGRVVGGNDIAGLGAPRSEPVADSDPDAYPSADMMLATEFLSTILVPGAEVPVQMSAGLVGCARDGETIPPLPAGEYRVYVVQQLRPEDPALGALDVVGGPWPLTIGAGTS